MWDLQRNGGSVAATSERILSGNLETVGFSLDFLFPFFSPSSSSSSLCCYGGSDGTE